MTILTKTFGYPKIGDNRELKKALEAYWAKQITKEEFFKEVDNVRLVRLNKQKSANIDYISSNDFSMYDFMLDTALMFGIIPQRFEGIEDKTDIYFSMARGCDNAVACEMTKWFDTNYHYIVPEISNGFVLKENNLLKSYLWVKENIGIDSVPSVVGPFTFLKLSKGYEKENFSKILLELSALYNEILSQLQKQGVKSVQIEEPALVLDLDNDDCNDLINAYKTLTKDIDVKISVQTYYESISNYEKIVNELPVDAIGLDFVVNNENLDNIKKYGFPKNKQLIAGVVSGRDIWKTDLKKTVEKIKEIQNCINQKDLTISNSAPLFHIPISLQKEKATMDKDLLELLSFADEKLEELDKLKKIFNENLPIENQNFEQIREKFADKSVQEKVKSIDENNIGRKVGFEDRRVQQQKNLNLPLFPTTTIGSFPQTKEVRKNRADYKKGLISKESYDDFIKNEIKNVVKLQEELELDVLVHGEFERNDMVEYFGEKLSGFAFSKAGWVQSYGSRCVKPPIIFKDVSRPEKMTVDVISYAQSLTEKPLKGMLTGPVTVLNWSFFRKDITKKEIAYQLALALKEEVMDLECAGIKIIQIDEAAFREGMPLKKAKQKEYLNWAVNAFKISNEEVKPETQIHTHMCYSEFNEILKDIYDMDSDVISIEATRSKGEVIEIFEKFNYNHQIGLGVYDIHSPRVPKLEEIKEIIERSIKVIDKDLFWINPDCGLKTRGYEETISSLKNMVKAAKDFRLDSKA